MKKIIVLLFVILVSSCSSKKELMQDEIKFIKLEHKVLNVDSKYKDIWIPSAEEIKQVKLGVCSYLSDTGLKGNVYVTKLKSNLEEYGFQFIGFYNKKSKRIWCNLIPRDTTTKWVNEIVKSENFGQMRIELEYDVGENQCYKFVVRTPVQ